LLRHLDDQLTSARRLLDAVLRQGAAIRNKDVDGVLARLAELQTEMERPRRARSSSARRSFMRRPAALVSHRTP